MSKLKTFKIDTESISAVGSDCALHNHASLTKIHIITVSGIKLKVCDWFYEDWRLLKKAVEEKKGGK